MTTEDKQDFANEAEKALSHALVEACIDELLFNLRINPHAADGLKRYGIAKVAMYAATVARAHALGIDPDALRMTDEETTEVQADLARTAAQVGTPVIVVETGGDDG